MSIATALIFACAAIAAARLARHRRSVLAAAQ